MCYVRIKQKKKRKQIHLPFSSNWMIEKYGLCCNDIDAHESSIAMLIQLLTYGVGMVTVS